MCLDLGIESLTYMQDTTTEPPNRQITGEALGKVYRKERKLESIRSGLNAASFAYGRRNAIRGLMHDRCGGECTTDDAELLVDLMMPFAVEAAHLHRGRDPLVDVEKFFARVMPAFVRRVGPGHIAGRVREALDQRAAAPTTETYVDWLPKMESLVADLRVTRDEVQRLGLRGWGCIDPASPEDRKEADRLRNRAARAAKGATPREQSASRTKPWDALGISRRTWERRQKTETAPLVDANTSLPCVLTPHGADEIASIPDAWMIAAADSAAHTRSA